jgi:hypothetical protein
MKHRSLSMRLVRGGLYTLVICVCTARQSQAQVIEDLSSRVSHLSHAATAAEESSRAPLPSQLAGVADDSTQASRSLETTDAGNDSVRAVYSIVLKDGSDIIGMIMREGPDTLVVETPSGIVMAIPRTQVKKLERLSGSIVQGEYLRRDPNNSRLMFAPTARPLKAGQGYVAFYEIFFSYFGVGIVDFFSVGGGMTLFPGATDQLYYVVPKLAIPLADETISLGVGAIYTNLFTSDFEGSGIVFGIGTAGTDKAAITVGLGYGFHGGDVAEHPVLVVGGEAQVSNSAKLISENWFPLGSDVSLLSFGVRFFGDKLAADIGFIFPLHKGEGISNGFPFIPWIGFAYNFGGG